MSDHEYVPKSKFGKWFNDRLPLLSLASHLTDYPTPKNLNYWWTFGGILTFCLITQIVTGLTLDWKEDALRRDFTINAIALEIKLNKLDIIDPLNGIKDINNKIIRILHQDSFKDDPTRIYRAIKYKSRLGFKFDNETKMNLYDSIKHIQNISTYRKNNEFRITK